MKRPTLTALVRAAHGLFFFVVSAYCVLSYTPFAFDVFIILETVKTVLVRRGS